MGLVTLGKEVHQLHLKKVAEFACKIFKDYAVHFKDEVGALPQLILKHSLLSDRRAAYQCNA